MLNRAFSLLFFDYAKFACSIMKESDCMGNTKFIKILGIACTIIGFGLTIIEDRLEDIKTEKIIEKEVSKQINKLKNEENQQI